MRPVSGSGDTNSDIARIKSTVQADKAGSGAFSHDKAGAAGKLSGAGTPGAAAKAAAAGKIMVAGQAAAAAKTAGLVPGSAASAAVSPASTTAGGRLTDFLLSLHIRPDGLALAAAQALMAEGLSLNRVHILQLRSFMRRFPGQEQVAAGAAARALASGVNLDDPLIERLAGFFSEGDGDTGHRQGSDSGQRQDAEGRHQPPAEGRQQIRAAKPAQPDELPGAASKTGSEFLGSGPAPPESVSRLTQALQKQAAGLLSDPGMREFHRPGPDGRAWLHIPLDFQQDSIEFHVMLRILYNYHSKSSEKLVLALEQNEALWLFDLDASDSTCRLMGDEAKLEFPEKQLRAALQRYGVALLSPQAAEAVQSPTLMRVDQHV